MKELTEAPMVSALRTKFDSARSFDLDDDLEFCPELLTDDDVCLLWCTTSTTSIVVESCSHFGIPLTPVLPDSIHLCFIL